MYVIYKDGKCLGVNGDFIKGTTNIRKFKWYLSAVHHSLSLKGSSVVDADYYVKLENVCESMESQIKTNEALLLDITSVRGQQKVTINFPL